MRPDLQTLIGKLNPVCRRGLEKAAELCVSQTHYNVEVEHLLLSLLDLPETDIHLLLRHYGVDAARVHTDLTRTMEELRRGNDRTPALSAHIIDLLEAAWVTASLRFGDTAVTSGSLFLALLDTDTLRGLILQSVPVLEELSVDRLRAEIGEILRMAGKEQNRPESDPLKRTADTQGGAKTDAGPTPALDQFTVDLTGRVRAGEVDPIQGRAREIRQIIDILTRRRQNNPILTGAAGVGKTAVVEGFAIRVVRGDVPPALKNVSVRLLDLGLLQAGAGIRGEFEKRLKSVIDEVKKSPRPVILFVDEAHALIGAGGQAGTGDAANLIKPALARGELRTIAATTWSEYKKYFEKDPALARRFQVIRVEEPSENEAVEMVRGLVKTLERHHDVMILDEAVRDAVRLSRRYLSGRQLPDKAISVMDTACARVALSQNTLPPSLEAVRHSRTQAGLELEILMREQAGCRDTDGRIDDLNRSLEDLGGREEQLTARWQAEQALAGQLMAVQRALATDRTGDGAPDPDAEFLLTEQDRLRAELAALQDKDPMLHTCVDAGIIADVISDWTGIPVGRMLTDEIHTILRLREKMAERIIGQPQALETICRRIHTFRASLDDPGKPAGVFLLVGSSGIGKTETALTLADILYGGDRNVISLNMSEYQEAYTVSGLKGSPPGYVGYGQGGVLTEAVRQKPYSVVLLDEVEKAHPDVTELFYQVFDKGTLEDAEGQAVDFKNTLILLTSNVGSDAILKACADPENLPDAETLVRKIWPDLLRHFKPAFLGRLVVVPYYPLDDAVIREIVRLKLAKIQERFQENYRADLSYSGELVAVIAARCNEVDTGARNVDHLLTHTVLPDLSAELLRRMAAGETCGKIHVGLDRDGNFAYAFDYEA
ncbi:type VI secretion system ATPase TssH [Desulfonema ishimotonii]|uniref:Type VI secretion system ATPase TssH n=1 Tax=Desulfonema ishimotonii TaxID=45657 RepID=A0A401FYT4_9BACT|nr:type VI secretion system ATPase TssH [Desulfonema ishimotonii]GBC62138.1 type VI secretion system ATPase TssH [Desulfonema ishimotonii]